LDGSIRLGALLLISQHLQPLQRIILGLLEVLYAWMLRAESVWKFSPLLVISYPLTCEEYGSPVPLPPSRINSFVVIYALEQSGTRQILKPYHCFSYCLF
jgi:hypothetical protein